MYSRDDLIDTLLKHLEQKFPNPPTPALSRDRERAAGKNRVFLTEYDIKKALTPGARHLTIPKDAIISPLAQDWLALKGIRILRS